MEVVKVVNKPVDSNSYIIYKKGESGCIVVDPGTSDCLDLIKYLDENRLKPDYIFLTHEHFDHVWGVNILKETYSCKTICSKECAERIQDRKKNMSVFYNQVGFHSYAADLIVENIDFRLSWNELMFGFLITKGHTDGSICISVGDNLFTGDTIIKNRKTVVKFPTGSKNNLLLSLDLIFTEFANRHVCIYPGHGDSFFLDEVALKQLI